MKHTVNEFRISHEEFMRRFHQEAPVPNLRDEMETKLVWCDPDELGYDAWPSGLYHTDEEIDLFQETIYYYTGALPIVIDDDQVILAGQGRVEAARLLGIERVPALVFSTLTSDEVQHYLETMKEFSDYVGWFEEMLSIDLQALRLMLAKKSSDA